MTKQIGISLLGTGTVGGELFDLLEQKNELLGKRTGYEFKIINAVARDTERASRRLAGKVPVVASWQEAIADPRCELVVELIGGETTALDIALDSLQANKPLITANKALLATSGDKLIKASHQHSTGIYFEAAVAGALPAIRILRDSLVGENISSIVGIINGTCNYILSNMSEHDMDFATALSQAARLGYAEADPALDIDGWDAAHKAVIMSWLAFGTPLRMDSVHVCGVRDIDLADLKHASRFNYAVKLIATIRTHPDGNEISVLPALVADDSNLAKVGNNLNAILFSGDASGELVTIGAGAGSLPTASAVVSDLVQAARDLTGQYRDLPAANGSAPVLNFDHVCCETYLRVQAVDSKGILAKLTKLLDQAEISVEAIHQDESVIDIPTDLILLLHEARWAQIKNCAQQIQQLDEVTAPPVIMPIAIPHSK